MRHLEQPRGPGTAWVFRLRTPIALIGTTNPLTGVAFGKEIKLGLKTRRLPEARIQRDILLGKIRELEATRTSDARYSIERAEAWAEAIAKDEETREGRPNEIDIRSIVYDEVEQAHALPRSKRPPRKMLETFAKVALRTGYPLDEAVKLYLEERKPGNRLGNKPLSRATENDVKTAVGYLKQFLGDAEGACLQDIDRKQAQRFRFEFLPRQTSARAPDGLSAKTTAKHITLLSGIWVWASQRGFVAFDAENPWKGARGIAKAAAPSQAARSMFTPQQATSVLRALPRGHKLGDVFRLALVTGCRVDEIASLSISDVEADAAGFTVKAGKTVNASRYVPLIGPAQDLLRARLARVRHEGNDRVFPEWPVRQSTGKSSALPAAFTRERRKLLGAETDGSLALHSTRHTWRTLARRAQVAEQTINDLGGWAGQKTSNSVYDHGLLKEQLHEAQEVIGERLRQEGYLDAY